MTQAEKTKEIERISELVNEYYINCKKELNDLISMHNRNIEYLITFEADKKGVSKELLKIILKDCKF